MNLTRQILETGVRKFGKTEEKERIKETVGSPIRIKRGEELHIGKSFPFFYVKLPDAYNKNTDDLSALFSTEFILKTEVIVFPIGRAIQAKTLFLRG